MAKARGTTQPLIDFTGVEKNPVAWLDRVFTTAMDKTWTDVQVRFTRGEELIALGQATGHKLIIRARIRRKMQAVAELEGRMAEQVINRIKGVAGIGTGPAIEPLDGLYNYVEQDTDGKTVRSLDIRVAVYPTYLGETIALRLPSTDGIITVDELNFSDYNKPLLKRILGIANGLVLLAGPMGSGKSTTLRAILLEMGSDAHNVWTVEDPVELQIPGVDQISINAEAGNGWPNVLTGLRRSDLEVLMIGEIRNYDQAAAALEIGNAGAKVISSIHANDSIGAVQQLMELADAKPRTLGNQLRAVVSQRLLRLRCEECAGFDAECEVCEGSGYKGMQPIHEILILDEDFINALAAGQSTGDLREVARRGGMLTLRESAQELVDQDKTTIEEVWRVLGDD